MQGDEGMMEAWAETDLGIAFEVLGARLELGVSFYGEHAVRY